MAKYATFDGISACFRRRRSDPHQIRADGAKPHAQAAGGLTQGATRLRVPSTGPGEKVAHTMNNGSTTSAELGLRLVSSGQEAVPLTASLYYSEDDPYAVRFAFHVGLDEPVEWVFARELLASGLDGDRGIGDVRVWPSAGGVLNIELISPFGRAQFEAPAIGISDFLRRTYDVVPAGQENPRVDVDAALQELLR